MSAFELRASPRVSLSMTRSSMPSASAVAPRKRARPVGRGIAAALGLSLIVHAIWSLWPVDDTETPEGTVLTATLTEMPPPPVPRIEPAPAPTAPRAKAARRAWPRAPAVLSAPQADVPAAVADARGPEESAAASAQGDAQAAVAAAESAVSAPATEPAPPAVALPPRVDLAYKVFLGTGGFLIGDATYRFEHEGDRYRISTVGQARGLAALIVRGTGRVESKGRITPQGLRPYEFSIERGSASKREVAFFDWDAGNVILQNGETAPLEPPTYDPMTIMWQPYFSPPGTGEQTFGLATTRKVARYTLTMQGEETITWRRGDIVTQRWHRRSDDGQTEAWLWLAPSMHHIPIKIRVTRTSRGTLEVLLDSIRADDGEAFGITSDAVSDVASGSAATRDAAPTVDDITYGMPGSGMPALRTEDLRGQ